jgi:hypothetical protein
MKDFEYTFELFFEKIKHVDVYLRHAYYDTENDFTPFFNDEEFELYNSIDEEKLLNRVREMVMTLFNMNANKNSKMKNDTLLYTFISCYIIIVKYWADCCLVKPYSFVLDMLEEFDDISFVKNKKKALSTIIKLEKEIFFNIFKSKNENLNL